MMGPLNKLHMIVRPKLVLRCVQNVVELCTVYILCIYQLNEVASEVRGE